MNVPNERVLESLIEASLLSSGYVKSEPSNFNRELGIDTADLFAFIGATQVREWDNYVARGHGGDVTKAQQGFARRIANELSVRGTVDVLRHGVADVGINFKLAYFKPAHGLTPELLEK